jgi:TonB family protein
MGQTSAVSKQDLESRFQKKVFFIRGFYIEDHLVYDAQGNVEGNPATGPWSIAAVRVERVRIEKDKFVLEGKRAVSVHDPKQNKFVEVVPRKAEHVDIRVEAPADTLSVFALDGLVQRMFLSRITAQDVPEWWQDFFSGKQRTVNDLARGIEIPGMALHGEPVFRITPGTAGVTPPNALFKPDPEYVEIARQARLQGTTVLTAVIDKQGIPERIQVARAIGIGLDDAAVEAVQKWRFSPARRNANLLQLWSQSKSPSVCFSHSNRSASMG